MVITSEALLPVRVRKREESKPDRKGMSLPRFKNGNRVAINHCLWYRVPDCGHCAAKSMLRKCCP